MRCPLALVLAAAAALAAAGCSTSPCQDLGERICTCSGLSSDSCKTQVEQELKLINETQADRDRCAKLLDTCEAPQGALFCEWLGTPAGKIDCGLAIPDPGQAGTTAN
jgi:hypothetical protein